MEGNRNVIPVSSVPEEIPSLSFTKSTQYTFLENYGIKWRNEETNLSKRAIECQNCASYI
jgi:hypothetical protein